MNEKQPDRELLIEISNKLNVLISISFRQLVGDKEFGNKAKRKQGAGEHARYLASMGLNPKDISEIIGAPLPSVRTLLTPSRQK